MKPSDRMESIRATPAGRRMIERERLWVEATEVLCRLMETRGVNSAELARRLEVSPARISQLLSGSRNPTLATLADAFHVLGRSMHVIHGPPTEKVMIAAMHRGRARGDSRAGGSTPKKSEESPARRRGNHRRKV